MAYRRDVVRAAIAGALLTLAGSGGPRVAHGQLADPVAHSVTVGLHPQAVAVDAGVGRAFVVNDGDGTVSVLDARSGRVLRTTGVGPGAPSVGANAVVVDPTRQRAFVLTRGNPTVGVLDTRSGALLRRTLVGREPYALAVATRVGHVFVTDLAANTVTMFDATTGLPLHTATVGKEPLAVAVDDRTGHVFVANFRDDSVSVLDARTGRVVRAIAVGAPAFAVAVDERAGRVFVATGAGVRVLDARRATTVQGTIAAGTEPRVMAVDGRTGRLFLGYLGGLVRTVDTRGGALVRTTVVGQLGVGDLVVAVRIGRVIVSSPDDGSVSVLDATSGALLRTAYLNHPVLQFPGAVAVDERAGRVFVCLPDGDTVRVLDASTLEGVTTRERE